MGLHHIAVPDLSSPGRRDRDALLTTVVRATVVARGRWYPGIAADFGYSRLLLAELGADRVISHFDDLAAAAVPLLGAVGAGNRPTSPRPERFRQQEV
ncbi:MAG: hypothetical protein GY798_07275 [Hyphomicrobiales bacterium]|nr:hypothetical protein [Hyphomicrobiales bacterium]